jgi:molecular chaperone GrpE (heat shock protein)
MAQSVRMREMEDYIKKIGELLNVVYKKVSEAESKTVSLETSLSKLKADVEDLKNENLRFRQNSVSKEEYEEFMSKLVDSLKGLLPEAPQEEVSSQPDSDMS